MAITVNESAASRPLVSDPSAPSGSRLYWAQSTDLTEEPDAIMAAVTAVAPATWLGMVIKRVSVDNQKGGLWNASVEYGLFDATAVEGQDGTTEPEPDPVISLEDHLGFEFSFSTGGGTQHILQSLSTVSSVALAPLVVPDTQKAIGVSKDTVEGCDIVIPKFEFSITRKCEFITMNYVKILALVTGQFNLVEWNTFSRGEILFLGADGKYTGNGNDDESWLLTYKFAFAKNQANIEIRDNLIVAEKLGWDYLWVGFLDEKDAAANVVLKKPSFAFVERVYERSDFRVSLGF